MPSIHLSELHPIIVHFPIALLLASVALDFAAVIFRRASLVEGATWALLLGAPSAVAAPTLLHLHKICAVLATIVFGTLFLLRLIWQSPRLLVWLRLAFPNNGSLIRAQSWSRTFLPLAYVKPFPRSVVTAYLLLSVVGVILLALTGYLGGALVYDHGIGLPIH